MQRSNKRITELRREFLSGLGVPKQAKFVPDDYQLAAIDALKQGHDTLVVAPTGAGKTYIAVEAIAHTVQNKRKAIYTAPLKALSNSKYAEFKKRFEPTYGVGLLTGDRKIEGDSPIVVATTEIYRNDMYGYSEPYGLVVLDEFHYLADPQRGPVWEESIILSPQSSTLLMLSASISNADEIAAWIEEVRKKKVTIIRVAQRPVELRLGFLHPELGVVPLEHKGAALDEVNEFYQRPRERRGERRGGRRVESRRGEHAAAKDSDKGQRKDSRQRRRRRGKKQDGGGEVK